MQARYSCASRQGHWRIILQVFKYLKHHTKGAIRSNTDVPDTLEEKKINKGCKDLYLYIEEKIPRDIPAPIRKWIKDNTTEVDEDHTHDLETRRSVTDILFFLTGTLQNWYSKWQHTVENSTYSPELVATTIVVDMIMEYC